MAAAALRPRRRDVISAILSDYEAMGRDRDDSPAPPARGDGRAAASQATIRSTAISRSRRPPSLKLSKSNGSTATATTVTSANTSTAADSTRLHHQLPLPPTPPHPPEKTAETMGNKPSKAAREDHHHLHHLRFTFRRKPVKQTPSPNPKPDSHPRLDRVASKPESKTSDIHSSPADVSTHSQAISDPTTLTDTRDLQSTPTIAPSRDNTNTPPSETETEEPLTPKLNSAIQLLPSPSPVPEESPSKYGLVNDGSMTMASGKSSTGMDLLVKSKEKPMFTPASQAKFSPPITAKVPISISTPTGTTAPAALVADTKSRNTFAETSPADAASLCEKFNNLPYRPKISDKPNGGYPPPPLAPVHVRCYHQHRTLHRARNDKAPVACMLCFSSDATCRWACAWCALRICSACRAQLDRTPGRQVGLVVKKRLEGGSSGVAPGEVPSHGGGRRASSGPAVTGGQRRPGPGDNRQVRRTSRGGSLVMPPTIRV